MKKYLISGLILVAILTSGCAFVDRLVQPVLENLHWKQGVILDYSISFGVKELTTLFYEDGTYLSLVVANQPKSWMLKEYSTVYYETTVDPETGITLNWFLRIE